METLILGEVRDGCVVIPLDRAIERTRIHHALGKSKTWGGFKRLVPPDAYEELVEAWRLSFEDEKDAEELEAGPAGDEEFELPNTVDDGCWPSWAQQDMLEDLSEEILKRFSETEDTSHSGEFSFIPLESMVELKAALVEEDYTCIEDQELVMVSQGFMSDETPESVLNRYGHTLGG